MPIEYMDVKCRKGYDLVKSKCKCRKTAKKVVKKKKKKIQKKTSKKNGKKNGKSSFKVYGLKGIIRGKTEKFR